MPELIADLPAVAILLPAACVYVLWAMFHWIFGSSEDSYQDDTLEPTNGQALDSDNAATTQLYESATSGTSLHGSETGYTGITASQVQADLSPLNQTAAGHAPSEHRESALAARRTDTTQHDQTASPCNTAHSATATAAITNESSADQGQSLSLRTDTGMASATSTTNNAASEDDVVQTPVNHSAVAGSISAVHPQKDSTDDTDTTTVAAKSCTTVASEKSTGSAARSSADNHQQGSAHSIPAPHQAATDSADNKTQPSFVAALLQGKSAGQNKSADSYTATTVVTAEHIKAVTSDIDSGNDAVPGHVDRQGVNSDEANQQQSALGGEAAPSRDTRSGVENTPDAGLSEQDSLSIGAINTALAPDRKHSDTSDLIDATNDSSAAALATSVDASTRSSSQPLPFRLRGGPASDDSPNADSQAGTLSVQTDSEQSDTTVTINSDNIQQRTDNADSASHTADSNEHPAHANAGSDSSNPQDQDQAEQTGNSGASLTHIRPGQKKTASAFTANPADNGSSQSSSPAAKYRTAARRKSLSPVDEVQLQLRTPDQSTWTPGTGSTADQHSIRQQREQQISAKDEEIARLKQQLQSLAEQQAATPQPSPEDGVSVEEDAAYKVRFEDAMVELEGSARKISRLQSAVNNLQAAGMSAPTNTTLSGAGKASRATLLSKVRVVSNA
ncbi:MAG: hypothetical protein AAF404_11835 [Pseudomonadota bacterium]